MSSAEYNCQQPLRVFAQSLTSPEAAEYILMIVESKTCILSLLLARDWFKALKILCFTSGSIYSPMMDSKSRDSGLHSKKMRPW